MAQHFLRKVGACLLYHSVCILIRNIACCALCITQADASEQLGVPLPRERQKQAYNKALVERFKHMPEVKRIVRHRHLPTVRTRTSSLMITRITRSTLALPTFALQHSLRELDHICCGLQQCLQAVPSQAALNPQAGTLVVQAHQPAPAECCGGHFISLSHRHCVASKAAHCDRCGTPPPLPSSSLPLLPLPAGDLQGTEDAAHHAGQRQAQAQEPHRPQCTRVGHSQARAQAQGGGGGGVSCLLELF